MMFIKILGNGKSLRLIFEREVSSETIEIKNNDTENDIKELENDKNLVIYNLLKDVSKINKILKIILDNKYVIFIPDSYVVYIENDRGDTLDKIGFSK